MRLIDADKLKYAHFVQRGDQPIGYEGTQPVYDYTELIAYDIGNAPTVKAIPIEQLLNILPQYDDYIHTKTYPYNETMEDIYSKGYEEGWNACLKHIKEELDYWEKENETN